MALDTTQGKFTPSERIVSPGVFTREIDSSFLAQGVAAIGGVVIAPFPKGPGFSPTVITSEADLTSMFGDADGVLYGPYTAQQYIRQQGQVTICRVGGLAGYVQHQALLLTAIPGQYDRFMESGSFNGKTVGTVLTYDPSGSTLYDSPLASGSFFLEGTISATYTTGIYAGSTVIVGDISSSIIHTNRTGSVLVAGQISASLFNSGLPHVTGNQITVSASKIGRAHV